MSSSPFRAIPSVEKLLQALGTTRPATSSRGCRLYDGNSPLSALTQQPNRRSFEEVIARVPPGAWTAIGAARIQGGHQRDRAWLLHTNLGRAPLTQAAIDRPLVEVGSNYSNLEYDLHTGERGGQGLLPRTQSRAGLLSAEAATVVNNCAAALVLLLKHFTRGDKKEIVISRGELIQIGGGISYPGHPRSERRATAARSAPRTSQRLMITPAAIGPATALVLKIHRK